MEKGETLFTSLRKEVICEEQKKAREMDGSLIAEGHFLIFSLPPRLNRLLRRENLLYSPENLLALAQACEAGLPHLNKVFSLETPDLLYELVCRNSFLSFLNLRDLRSGYYQGVHPHFPQVRVAHVLVNHLSSLPVYPLSLPKERFLYTAFHEILGHGYVGERFFPKGVDGKVDCFNEGIAELTAQVLLGINSHQYYQKMIEHTRETDRDARRWSSGDFFSFEHGFHINRFLDWPPLHRARGASLLAYALEDQGLPLLKSLCQLDYRQTCPEEEFQGNLWKLWRKDHCVISREWQRRVMGS